MRLLVFDRAMAVVEQPFGVLGQRLAAQVAHQVQKLGIVVGGDLLGLAHCPAEDRSNGYTNSSSPLKRGPRGKRLKSLGSRFRGNDG